MMNESQLMRLDLNLLLPFVLLHEERHAGRVAARLNLSPSAVSHALRRLRSTFDDPLFVPGPRGMAPTARAEALAPLARDLVAQAEALMASSTPFDPATSRRRFRIGAPDAAIATMVPALVERLAGEAPGIDLSLVTVLPAPRTIGPEEAWSHVIEQLDGGQLDAAILPYRPLSPRIEGRHIHDEQFAVAFRRGHPFGDKRSLSAFAEASHILVSATGDPSGLVDRALAEKGLSRRIALTVPHFFMALDVIGRTDLIGAIPRRFAMHHADAFGLDVAELPVPQPESPIYALALKAAIADRGIAWLLDQLAPPDGR